MRRMYGPWTDGEGSAMANGAREREERGRSRVPLPRRDADASVCPFGVNDGAERAVLRAEGVAIGPG